MLFVERSWYSPGPSDPHPGRPVPLDSLLRTPRSSLSHDSGSRLTNLSLPYRRIWDRLSFSPMNLETSEVDYFTQHDVRRLPECSALETRAPLDQGRCEPSSEDQQDCVPASSRSTHRAGTSRQNPAGEARTAITQLLELLRYFLLKFHTRAQSVAALEFH